MSSTQSANKHSLVERALTTVKAILEEKAPTLQMMIGMLKNAREYQVLKDELEEQAEESPDLCDTTAVPDVIEGCKEAMNTDRAAACHEANTLRQTLHCLETVVDNYIKANGQTAELVPDADAVAAHDHLVWLKTCIRDHGMKLIVVRNQICEAWSTEAYIEKTLSEEYDRKFGFPRATQRNVGLKEGIHTDLLMAEQHVGEILHGVREMLKTIQNYRCKISNHPQDLYYMDISN